MAEKRLQWPGRAKKAKPKRENNPRSPSTRRSGNPSGYQLGISDEKFWETLRANAGLVAQTAEALGTSYMTAYKRAANQRGRWEEIILETREKVTDIAEAHFVKAVQRGDKDARDKWLRYHARGRGYVTKVELGGPGGGPIPVAGAVDVTIKLVRSKEEQS